MSNWFERNPTKSIISYTLMIVGATWAISTFILQDNRISLLRSEIESHKTLTEQYKSKAELLQRDIDTLRAENAEYRAWLGQTKDAVPVMIPRLTEMKAKLAALEAEAQYFRKQNSSTVTTLQEQYVGLGVGRAFIDEFSGLVVMLKKTFPDRTAELVVKLPGESMPISQTIHLGHQWKFMLQGKSYTVTVYDISFIGDGINFKIAAAP